MKKYLLTLMACAGLFMTACSNNEEPENKPEKKRLEISLTRSESETLKSINDFAFDLLKAVNEEKVKRQAVQNKGFNYLISPLGASVALGMAANGAQGETLKEITDMLKIGDGSLDDLNECSRTLINALTAPENQIAMKVTNSLYSSCYKFQPDYLAKVGEYYNASQTDEALYNPDAPLEIVDILEFQGRWDTIFRKKNTKTGVFRNADSSEGEAFFMNGIQPALATEDDFCCMLRKMMDKTSFSFDFIVPSGDNTIEDVISQLTYDYWTKMTMDLKRYEVNISIPKFKMEKDETSLIVPAQSLGMSSAFDSRKSEISGILTTDGISSVNTFIDEFKQKSSITVDEEGAYIKVETIITGETAIRLDRNEFILDEPFIYIVSENSTGAILFMGKVSRFKDFELY